MRSPPCRSLQQIGLGDPRDRVAAGLGWLALRPALRPVRSITEAAKRASELRLGERLALTGPDDEFKQLADTFDMMLERLDAAFTSQKRFVANAAHELRTPLDRDANRDRGHALQADQNARATGGDGCPGPATRSSGPKPPSRRS